MSSASEIDKNTEDKAIDEEHQDKGGNGDSKESQDWWRDMMIQSKRDHWKYVLGLYLIQFAAGTKAVQGKSDLMLGVHVLVGGSIVATSAWLVYLKFYVSNPKNRIKRRVMWPSPVDRSIQYHYIGFSMIIIAQMATKLLPFSYFAKTIEGANKLHQKIGVIGILYSLLLASEKVIFYDLAAFLSYHKY